MARAGYLEIAVLRGFFFNDTATTEIYTLSLHDALPIWLPGDAVERQGARRRGHPGVVGTDRKSTRLNSSHLVISYAVSCLKKKTRGLHPHGGPRQFAFANRPARLLVAV